MPVPLSLSPRRPGNKPSATYFLIFVASLALGITSCKKSKTGSTAVDQSGSLLDSHIDTTWKASDGRTVKIEIKTYKGDKDPLYNDTREAFHADLYVTVLAGKVDNLHLKLKYRHFPQKYFESEISTGGTYEVNETAASTIDLNPEIFPILEIYHYLPDPGPIDKVEISL